MFTVLLAYPLTLHLLRAEPSPGREATRAGSKTASVSGQTDKYLWLEDVWGKKSLDWVKAENERSAKVLESDPRFPKLQAEALKVAESPDRLPDPEFRNGTNL